MISAAQFLKTVIIVLLYFGSAKLVGPLSLSPTSSVFVIWPPTGVALAALVIWGRMSVVGIFLGAFLLNGTLGTVPAALQIAVGNTLGPYVVFELLTRLKIDRHYLSDFRSLITFTAAAVVGAFITATLGVIALSVHEMIPAEAALGVWPGWMGGDLIGFLLVGTLLLYGDNYSFHCRDRRFRREYLTILAVICTLSWILFAPNPYLDNRGISLEYLILLPFLWVGIRFGVLSSYSLVLIVTALMSVGTLWGYGPFISDDINESLYLLQLFVVIMTLKVMVLIVSKTALTKAKKELVTALEKLSHAQKITHIGHWDYNYQKRTLEWSNELYQILGWDKKRIEPSFRYYLQRIAPQERQEVLRHYRKSLNQSEPVGMAFDLNLDGGVIKHVEAMVKHERRNDQLIASYGTLQDVTEKKVLEFKNADKERMLHHQAKLAAMGEMISNIAHQWRQPINVISMNVNNIQIDMEYEETDPQRLSRRLDDIINQTEYLSRTIDDFKDFFKPDAKAEDISTQTLFHDLEMLLSSKLYHNEVVLKMHIEDMTLHTYKNRLEHALINIINNALDALKQKQIPKRYIFIEAYAKEGHLYIAIKDNAGGIPADLLPKVFEPYFTTKHKTQGTGLGLYMTQEIITKHLNGTVSVINVSYTHNGESYTGAQFLIDLKL